MEFLETLKDTITTTLSDANDYLAEETTVTRKTIVIIGCICILVGVIYGFFIAPIKKGFINVTNNTDNYYEIDEDEE